MRPATARGTAALPQQKKRNFAEVQRKIVHFTRVKR
jgi:hypothetical protein